LEPDNALALNLMGKIELLKGNMPESLIYRKLAFSKDPNVPDNLRSLIYYYGFFAGKPSVATMLTQRLLQIDPLSPRNPRSEGIVAWMEGRFDIALELHGKVSQMVSDAPLMQWYYAQLLAWNNRFDEAYEYIDKFVKNLPQHILSWSILLFKHSLQGEKDRALQLLTEERKSYAARDYHFPWVMAECFALLNEKEDALNWLELAIDKGWINYPLFSELDPFLENIRGEARFKKLIEKVKYEWQHIEDLEWPKEL
jgi:non-specific serine/threonine protein kinase